MRLLKLIIGIIFTLAYPHFKNKEYKNWNILRYIFMQKILGFNRKVCWPVHFTSQINTPEKIIPGSKAPGYSMGCYIDGRNGIIIEENVWIGPRVSVISMNHQADNYNKYVTTNPIIIRKNSLLTTNCIILPGVELGEHTIVAAGAVVTKSFSDGNQVLAGNPARVIKKLNDYKAIIS